MSRLAGVTFPRHPVNGAFVHPLRRLIRRHRRLAAGLVVLALAMKLLMPAGFMPTVSGGGILVQICSGTSGQMMAMTLPGTAGNQDEHPAAKADMPCAFAGLSTPSLAAADPIMLALAILFAVAAVFRAPRLVLPASPAFLRPPLRGPPAVA